MPTNAKPSKNTQMQIGDGAQSETFTTIGEIKNIKGPGIKADAIDVTSQDSTTKEFISSALPENGEVSFEMNFIGKNAQQQQLRADVAAGTARNFKLIFNDHASTKTTATFAAIVTAFDQDAPAGAAYNASATLKPTGAVTWSYAAS